MARSKLFFASSLAMPSPMPRLPPVINATLFMCFLFATNARMFFIFYSCIRGSISIIQEYQPNIFCASSPNLFLQAAHLSLLHADPTEKVHLLQHVLKIIPTRL